MAYACPVCAEPQVDADHLANHVAFTAITGEDAHEAWLEDTVEDWGELGRDELAPLVVEHATETDFPVDVDAAGERAHDHGEGDRADPAGQSGQLDAATRDVLVEARDLTRRMQGGDTDGTAAAADRDEVDDEERSPGEDPASRTDSETQ